MSTFSSAQLSTQGRATCTGHAEMLRERSTGRLFWVPLPGLAVGEGAAKNPYKSTVARCSPGYPATCPWWVIAGWAMGGDGGESEGGVTGVFKEVHAWTVGRECILWTSVTNVHWRISFFVKMKVFCLIGSSSLGCGIYETNSIRTSQNSQENTGVSSSPTSVNFLAHLWGTWPLGLRQWWQGLE